MESVSIGLFCSLYVLRISTDVFGTGVGVAVVISVVIVVVSIVVVETGVKVIVVVAFSEVNEVVDILDSVVNCSAVDRDPVGVVDITEVPVVVVPVEVNVSDIVVEVNTFERLAKIYLKR